MALNGLILVILIMDKDFIIFRFNISLKVKLQYGFILVTRKFITKISSLIIQIFNNYKIIKK